MANVGGMLGMLMWVSGSRRPSGGTVLPVIGSASPAMRVPGKRVVLLYSMRFRTLAQDAGVFDAAGSPWSLE